MAKVEPKLIGEALYWSYANLGMAHKAVSDNAEKYTQLHYIIRNKLYHGLLKGNMDIRSLFHEEKSKLHADKCCVYCGNIEKLTIDHIIPQNMGGQDSGDNLVLACRKCNSSKGDLDLLEWFFRKDSFPPLLRNYLKLVIIYCRENDLMGYDLETSCELNLPFSIVHLPFSYPKPNLLTKRITIKQIEA
ncbi:HNH endonuclease [Rubrolithibacter danxiaensis]|uniref:HNH endonuclease n=1 Tax=Rubrolithibacter danxiaensis TaxID=3390805 RepID=UPI003BF8CFEF